MPHTFKTLWDAVEFYGDYGIARAKLSSGEVIVTALHTKHLRTQDATCLARKDTVHSLPNSNRGNVGASPVKRGFLSSHYAAKEND